MTSPLQTPALDLIDAYIRTRGISEATFGSYAVNDATFVRRLRDGKANFATAQRALDYIATQEAASVVLASANTVASVGSVGGGDDTDSGREAVRSPEKRVA